MFRKNSLTTTSSQSQTINARPASVRKEAIPSIITQDINILGNIVSEGAIDLDGVLEGNVRCGTLTLRKNGIIKGEIIADVVHIYGKARGLIRARSVHLHSACHVEGIIMHETMVIEEGAFVDGKFKRTDKLHASENDEDSESSTSGDLKVLENIRLIG